MVSDQHTARGSWLLRLGPRMAVNWIKARGTLSSDIHVLEMADFLKPCKHFAEYLTGSSTGHYSEECAAKVLAFAMVEIWSHVMEQGERDGDDALLPLATVDRLDRLCGVPRMGEAVLHCGWVLVDAWNGRKCLRFPNLLKNNVLVKEQGQSVRERVAKYRAKKAEHGNGHGVHDVTGRNGYTPLHVTPQKRREEREERDTNTTTPTPPKPSVPHAAGGGGGGVSFEVVKKRAAGLREVFPFLTDATARRIARLPLEAEDIAALQLEVPKFPANADKAALLVNTAKEYADDRRRGVDPPASAGRVGDRTAQSASGGAA